MIYYNTDDPKHSSCMLYTLQYIYYIHNDKQKTFFTFPDEAFQETKRILLTVLLHPADIAQLIIIIIIVVFNWNWQFKMMAGLMRTN